MDDLDALLEDLGRPKSTANANQKKARAPSSRVDLNELEDLMADLATTSPKPAAAAKPAAAPAPAPAPVAAKPTPAAAKPAAAKNDMDDLDALMDSLNAPASKPAAKPAAAPAAAAAAPPPAAAPANTQRPVSSQPQRAVQAANVDDLDALLSSLDAPSKPAASNRQSQAPAAAPAPAAARPTSTYNAPASNPAPAQPRPVSSKPAASGGSDLDNLLSNLTDQMQNIDSNPASRGMCAACKKSILGEVIQALGKTFHPEHFVCGNCQSPLGTANFFEVDSTPHCEKCYQESFCPRCAHCDGPIMDRCVTALGRKWHLDHFICTVCLKPFPNGSFFERDGRPYCEADFYSAFAPKCGSCSQAIKGECINALGQQWHPEHFVCQYCQKSFGGGNFYEYQGKPYCEVHYHQQTGALCGGCGKAITGRCVNALTKRWHPEHFVCAFCMNPLAGGSFTENNGKAYCKECYGKLFG